MASNHLPLWKEAPFLRLIVPFAGGILLGWLTGLPMAVFWIVLVVCTAVLISFFYFNSFFQFRFYHAFGWVIYLLLLCTGALVTQYKDVRHQPGWIGTVDPGGACIVKLEEPLSRKGAAYRAVAAVEWVQRGPRIVRTTGKVILYFASQSPLLQLSYGSRIVVKKPLQRVKNMGNPGGFDYSRYCALQNIYHQVYLQPGDWVCLPVKENTGFTGALFVYREKIAGILRRYTGKEAGLAEALLIGYKDDLDKELVQSYTNTGVVHIIAISGLHLGLIYWLLAQLFGVITWLPFRWLRPLLIITCLWVFSLLTGGSPSVMRSAVMFTFVVGGQTFGRKSAVYNQLAASAFLLLCYNPCWLWDAGFQLSYGAVLSIVVFMRPFYNWFYVKNKLLDTLVKLSATSLAAQVLTMPVSVYLFHQFPVYFLLTNIIAVPLSSLVVLAEIAVCAFSWMPWLAAKLGTAVSWLILAMNHFIAYMEHLPFSMWGGMNITLLQTGLLYMLIVALSGWLLQKKPPLLLPALGFLLCFILLRTASFLSCQQQEKLVVYNVPKHQAMDLVSGRYAVFVADKALLLNPALLKANVQPAGNLFRFNQIDAVPCDSSAIQGFCVTGKKILLLNGVGKMQPLQKKLQPDVVVVSGNSRFTLDDLLQVAGCKVVVFDSSNPDWKVNQWKQACGRSGVNCYPVAEKGAFVFNPD